MNTTPVARRWCRALSLGVGLGAALVSPLAACERSQQRPGDRLDGVACEDADQCAGGYCVAGVAGEQPACTRTCATGEDCADGWSCSAVTDRGVLVCQRGGATPFGM